jgi:signal transduction histidine kinase
MPPESPLADYAWNEATWLCLELDESGRVRRANTAVQTLFGADWDRQPFAARVVNFQGLNLETLIASCARRQRLSVETATPLPETFLFSFFPLPGGGRLVIGEPDLPPAHQIERQMLDITNELSNLSRELAQKNAELERLNALKNEFVGMAAHDLRSPIASILSFSEVLLEESKDLPELQVTGLTHIRRLSTSMLALLNDLLDLTAIEAGRLTLHPKPCNPITLVRDAVEVGRLLGNSKEIIVELEIAPDAPTQTVWDEEKIRQVLTNLISNAIKFSPRNTRVDVRLGSAPGQAAITVTDQGQGIAAGDAASLFKPFSRTRARPTGEEKSTGLGLAIVHRIVTAHGGTVTVASEPDQGAAFHVTLPLAIQEGNPP